MRPAPSRWGRRSHGAPHPSGSRGALTLAATALVVAALAVTHGLKLYLPR